MITSLTLTNFRNHASNRINIGGAKNIIITGPNGSGKTAILEAVSLLGGGQGLRSAKLEEMLRFDTNSTISNQQSAINSFAVFAALNDDTEISVSYAVGDSNRRARVDGDNAPLSELARYLRIVWLTPREDRIFVDGASERRAFFDRLVAGLDTAHTGRVARLSKLLSERGYALKNGADENWLCAIEKNIAATAVAVACARINYIGRLNYFLESVSVTVSGMIENMLANNSALDVEKEYLTFLSENRILTNEKMSVDGAHRSDFGAFNKTLDLPVNITSTGQQKQVLIDIILGHVKLIDTPSLVLLDEADSHLDTAARTRMFDALEKSGAQVFATGIDKDIFTDIDNAMYVCL